MKNLESEIIKTSYGIFECLKNDKYFYKCLKKDEMFHPKILEWITSSIDEGTVFIDIGANIGMYSIPASLSKKNIGVISLEPQPEIARILRNNFSLNKIKDFKVVEKAATSSRCSLYINSISGTPNENTGDNRVDQSEGDIKIEGQRVDSIEIGAKVSMIKIDVQGHDYEALVGCEKIIDRDLPKILIEWEGHMVKTGHSFSDVCKFLFPKGYSVTKRYDKDFMFEVTK
jgi:FkbM family methyltransferase